MNSSPADPSSERASPLPDGASESRVLRAGRWLHWAKNRPVSLVLSYLGPLCLIPLAIEQRESPERWHAKHGLVLWIADVLLLASIAILGIVLTVVTGGFVLPIFIGLGASVVLFLAALHVLLMVKAIEGVRLVVAGVSHYADRF